MPRCVWLAINAVLSVFKLEMVHRTEWVGGEVSASRYVVTRRDESVP